MSGYAQELQDLVRELAEALANAGLLRTAIAKAAGAAPEKEPSE